MKQGFIILMRVTPITDMVTIQKSTHYMNPASSTSNINEP